MSVIVVTMATMRSWSMGPRLYCTILMILMSCLSAGEGREARIRLEVGSQEAEYDNDEMNYSGVGMEIGFFMPKAK